MIYVWLWLSLISVIACKKSSLNTCENCQGKIHTYEQLELTKQPLIINQNQTCFKEKYKFIVIVKSGNYQRRNLTRSTWGKELIEYFNIPVLYALASPNNASIQYEIFTENELFQDILQFNIIENYYNLTLKTISVFVWYDKYCSKHSDYLLYVDDDVLIHVDRLIGYMNEMNRTSSIEGWFETMGNIQRKGFGGVSKSDFPIDIVPDYLWGAAVLYPSKILSGILLRQIFNTTIPIFFRDDVFINGFMADEAKIARQSMKGLVLYDPSEDDLEANMIVIDFKNEIDRKRAWNCYHYGEDCNKNLFVLILKIVLIICLISLVFHYVQKLLQRTSFYSQLIYELTHVYREWIQLFYISQKNIFPNKFFIRWWKKSFVCICIVFLGFYFFIKNII